METPATIMDADKLAEKSGVDENDGELTDVVRTAMKGIVNGLEKIGECVDEMVDKIEAKFEHAIGSFIFSLPSHPSMPENDEENLGNNVYLPSLSSGSNPYRFGLHIKRDELGYRIARVFGDTIAHHAKLEKNDILTHLNDTDLSSTNIVKVITLFSKVGNPFFLTILRELESGEITEIVIQITIQVMEVERSIEFKVTVRGPRYIRDTRNASEPYYITQDPDEHYVNIASNGNLFLGHNQVPFVFEKYLTIFDNNSLPSIFKTADGRRAFSFTNQRMVDFNERMIMDFMMTVRESDNGSVFEQLCRQDDNEDRHFLHNSESENQIVVSSFESPESVPMSGRFVLYSADSESTTRASSGSDEEGPRRYNRVQ